MCETGKSAHDESWLRDRSKRGNSRSEGDFGDLLFAPHLDLAAREVVGKVHGATDVILVARRLVPGAAEVNNQNGSGVAAFWESSIFPCTSVESCNVLAD